MTSHASGMGQDSGGVLFSIADHSPGQSSAQPVTNPAARIVPRRDFRAAAQQVCTALRHVLPHARSSGSGDSRPPRFRVARARRRVALRRRRSQAARPANDQLQGILSAIADDVQGRAAALSAGMQAQIAARINDALATAPKEQHAGIIQGLEAELRGILATIAADAAVELRGRQQAAIMANGSTGAPSQEGELIEDVPDRPEEVPVWPRQASNGLY